MFCMCIDSGCVGTEESKLGSVCVLTVGVGTGESKLCSI